MYYVILGVSVIVLFLLRKRILGGLVGVISLLLVIGLTIFMLDFFWLGQNFRGEDRDIRNFQPTQTVVEEYDDVVKDPVQKAKDIGSSVVDKGSKVNDKAKSTGATIDEKLGIAKDTSNNNLWGSDTNQEQESKNNKNKNKDKTGNNATNKHDSDEIHNQSTNSNKEKGEKGSNQEEGTPNSNESNEIDKQNTKSKNKLKFNQLNKADSMWGITKEDAQFVKSASPFNLGEYSNGNITILIEDDGVTLK